MSTPYKHIVQKTFLATLVKCLCCITASGQYYYKDLLSTQQINETFNLYQQNKVGTVTLNSYQGSTPVTEGFECEQKVNLARRQVVTYTKTADAGATYFTAYYNPQGMLVQSVDSTPETVSTSLYTYASKSRLLVLEHQTRATDNSSTSTEKHIWQYSSNGSLQQMIRIKDGSDSTIVRCTVDEKGNVTEEEAMHKGTSLGKIYYYYDAKNRLTDIVRYNARAGRLMPDYIFEYEENGELSTMTVVPEGSNDYQKWYYKYNEGGLKAVEFCYNKKSVLLGKVEYTYTQGR